LTAQKERGRPGSREKKLHKKGKEKGNTPLQAEGKEVIGVRDQKKSG